MTSSLQQESLQHTRSAYLGAFGSITETMYRLEGPVLSKLTILEPIFTRDATSLHRQGGPPASGSTLSPSVPSRQCRKLPLLHAACSAGGFPHRSSRQVLLIKLRTPPPGSPPQPRPGPLQVGLRRPCLPPSRPSCPSVHPPHPQGYLEGRASSRPQGTPQGLARTALGAAAHAYLQERLKGRNRPCQPGQG